MKVKSESARPAIMVVSSILATIVTVFIRTDGRMISHDKNLQLELKRKSESVQVSSLSTVMLFYFAALQARLPDGRLR